MNELLGQGCGLLELRSACKCLGMVAVSGAGHPCGGWQPIPITPLCSPSMCEDTEQIQPAEAPLSTPRIHTPLLSRFLAAASPAISIKNLGRGSRAHSHLRHPRLDGGFPSPYPNRSENPESVACIEEEEMEDEESRASESTTPGCHLGGTQPPEASKTWRKELPLIQVKGPSSESIGADQPEVWEP